MVDIRQGRKEENLEEVKTAWFSTVYKDYPDNTAVIDDNLLTENENNGSHYHDIFNRINAGRKKIDYQKEEFCDVHDNVEHYEGVSKSDIFVISAEVDLIREARQFPPNQISDNLLVDFAYHEIPRMATQPRYNEDDPDGDAHYVLWKEASDVDINE